MNKREQAFVTTVWQYYEDQGRHNLPWRKTTDSYRIMVSEVMLQQTQVERVVPKYRAFVRMFPTARRLAAAPLREVLQQWQGLGYNRRARFLWEAAKVVVNQRANKFPMDMSGLLQLPGVGPYTAGAIMVFAYNQPVPIIETNIRQVYLQHFFKNENKVPDTDILTLVERTQSTKRAREWYWALMDYGSFLKQKHGNNNHRSKQYSKQSKFQGSDRQIRGAIIRVLAKSGRSITKKQLCVELTDFAVERVAAQLGRLVSEGLVSKRGAWYGLG